MAEKKFNFQFKTRRSHVSSERCRASTCNPGRQVTEGTAGGGLHQFCTNNRYKQPPYSSFTPATLYQNNAAAPDEFIKFVFSQRRSILKPI